MGLLIDTCIWIDVEQGRLAPGDIATLTGDAAVFMSPVTIAELKFGVVVSETSIRQQRLAALRRLQNKPLLVIDGNTGEIFGDLAATLKNAGRMHRYRVQDLWLASQAIQHGYRLLNRNQRDFQDIPALDLIVI